MAPRWLERLLTALFRVIWVALDNVIAIPVYLVCMILFYPCQWIWPSFYWALDSWLTRELLRTIGYWIWTAGYDIVEYGDLPHAYQDERCLVIVNHLSSADVPILCSTICRKGAGGGKVAWILDSMFKCSSFGFVNYFRGDFFITSGKDVRRLQTVLLAAHMRKEYWKRDRRWFIIFPEGGFLCNRRESNERYAVANDLPLLTYCTLPRVVGVKTMLDTANPVPQDPDDKGQEVTLPPAPGPGFRFLIDVTIAYPNGELLGLEDIAFGVRPPCEVGIHYRRIPIADVPHHNETALRDFLYNLYVQKDAMLAHFYKRGHFPGIPRLDGVVVEYHTAGLIFTNCMFLFFFLVLGRWVVWPILHGLVWPILRCTYHMFHS